MATLLPQVTQISHKHRALQILPEHYPIVGKHLIGAIKEVLGEAANDDIITAWTEAYDEIASVFIQIEHGMYEEAMWQGFSPFKVTEKVAAATDIAAFTVVPVNEYSESTQSIDLSKLNLTAGQYITVKTDRSKGQRPCCPASLFFVLCQYRYRRPVRCETRQP